MTELFTQRVVKAIKRIPKGKVATYGQIAAIAGSPRAARQVVRILHTQSSKEKLPWHRVINSKGEIGLKPGEGYELQKKMLEDEGVNFKVNNSVDLIKFQWQPKK